MSYHEYFRFLFLISHCFITVVFDVVLPDLFVCVYSGEHERRRDGYHEERYQHDK